MIIGVPKEIKESEYRVGATPALVQALCQSGHKVFVETEAGSAVGFSDERYKAAGAEICSNAVQVYEAQMIVKVKELQESEFVHLHEGQILFCYLHLAPDPVQTKHLIDKKVVAIAYETVTDAQGLLPLLTPMSEIAGRVAIQAGANCLQMNNGGSGLLLGGVPGVVPANVVVVGGGAVGLESARMAMGLGADVTILDKNLARLRQLDAQFGPRLKTLFSNPLEIEKALERADLLIGAVLIPGKAAPKLVTRQMISKMKKGSVAVDVSIDQGGCFETSAPTTHSNPTFTVDGVLHYCVTNMPGACAKTATQALTNATFDYVLQIANKGVKQALLENMGLLSGLNVSLGKVTHPFVAADLNYSYHPPENSLPA